MASLREALEALLDGKKIRQEEWRQGESYQLHDGTLVHEDLQPVNLTIGCKDGWEILSESNKIQMTKNDVGRKVLLNDGSIGIISFYYAGSNEFLIGRCLYSETGERGYSDKIDRFLD